MPPRSVSGSRSGEWRRRPRRSRPQPAFRRALSVAHQHLGDAIAQLGDRAGTLESYQRARAIRAALVAEFPDNNDYQKLLGSVDFWIGGVLAEMGRYQEALMKYRAGLAGDSAQAIRDPRNAATRAGMAFSLARVGDMLLKLGKPGEALADLPAEPGDPRWRSCATTRPTCSSGSR